MWTEQRVGPFSAGEVIVFPVLRERASNSGFKYVRIGIQSPQSPYVTEVRKIEYEEFQPIENDGEVLKKAPLLQQPTRTTNSYVIDNTHCFTNGIVIDGDNGDNLSNMHKFYISTNDFGGTEFRINAGEVLEFNDMRRLQYFKVRPAQNEDAYTIIEIQYLDSSE